MDILESFVVLGKINVEPDTLFHICCAQVALPFHLVVDGIDLRSRPEPVEFAQVFFPVRSIYLQAIGRSRDNKVPVHLVRVLPGGRGQEIPDFPVFPFKDDRATVNRIIFRGTQVGGKKDLHMLKVQLIGEVGIDDHHSRFEVAPVGIELFHAAAEQY